MKEPTRKLALLLHGLMIGLSFVAIPAFAQDSSRVDRLERLVEAQQRQLETQKKQIDALMRMVQDVQAQKQHPTTVSGTESASSAAAKPSTTATVPAPTVAASRADAERKPMTVAGTTTSSKPPQAVAKPLPEIGATLSQDFRHDRVSPTGANVTRQESRLNLPIPGTQTEIGIHGFAMMQAIHDTVGTKNCEFDTFLIPVDGAPAETKFCVNPSRLVFTSKSGVPAGRLNTVVSMDFNGTLDSPEPRLRVAYGEWINDDLDFALLAGQTFGTMLDLKSVPETLDFAGPTGYFARRQPLFRFTKLFGRTVLAEIAAETPENVSYLDAEKRTRWPDLAIAGTWNIGGNYLSHVRVAGLGRDLRAEGLDGSTDSAFGWAVVGSTKLKLPFLGARDNLKIGLQYGEGYGAQIKSGPDDAVFDDENSKLRTIGVFSTYGGLQHWWSDRLRSNLVYGYVDAKNPGAVGGDELDNTTYAAANLVWNPYERITLGVEYLWGQREDKDGESGTANRFLFSSKFDF